MQKLAVFMLALCAYMPFGKADGYTLMTGEVPPYTSEQAGQEGIVLDVVREVFRRSGLELSVRFAPWVRSQKIALEGRPEDKLLATPLTRTPEREAHYDWVLPIYSYELQFLTNDPGLPIHDVEALRHTSTCVLRESPAQFQLKRLDFSHVTTKTSEVECIRLLKAGRVKTVFVHGRLTALHNYRQQGGALSDLLPGASFPAETIYLGSTPGAVSTTDKAKILQSMEQIKTDGTYRRIVDRYEQDIAR